MVADGPLFEPTISNIRTTVHFCERYPECSIDAFLFGIGSLPFKTLNGHWSIFVCKLHYATSSYFSISSINVLYRCGMGGYLTIFNVCKIKPVCQTNTGQNSFCLANVKICQTKWQTAFVTHVSQVFFGRPLDNASRNILRETFQDRISEPQCLQPLNRFTQLQKVFCIHKLITGNVTPDLKDFQIW